MEKPEINEQTIWNVSSNLGKITANISNLDKKINEQKTDLSSVINIHTEKLDILSKKIEEKNLYSVIMWIVLCITISGILIGVATSQITNDLHKMSTALEQTILRPEYTEKNSSIKESLTALKSRIDELDKLKMSKSDIDNLKIELNAKIIELNRRLELPQKRYK